MNHDADVERSDEIAIIGMAGRFPDAATIAEFWRNLCQGVESVRFFSDAELLAAGGTDEAMLADPSYVKAGCILDEVETFDAAFFGYSPREVEIMDPQHRLFLETAWETLEHAGYNPESYPGAISVFGGTSLNKYLLMNILPSSGIVKQYGGLPLLIGSDKDFLTTRVSYKLNLKGASVNVQTACSTSLVAIHMACQSLLNGECEMALAGGVSVQVPQKIGYTYVEGGTTSIDGHCRAFDADARGTVPGSGSAMVLLKRFADALADGDTIHAVIKGSAINNDGAQKVGYTAPSVDGQTGAIGEALAMAGVEAETVTYVETHGTATPLGDPIEIAALTQVFRASTAKQHFCAIGSVKTNIGHLDAAAGAAGLIKTVLALQHRQIPPSLHYKRPNPKIDFANSPFFVNTELREWQADGPLRAGVSSFGIGGTNAHVVLEAAPEREVTAAARPWQLLTLSARSESALEQMTTHLQTHLQNHPTLSLPDVAYTLHVGRKTFAHRRVLVARATADVVQALETRDPQRLLQAMTERQKRPVALLFGGVGDQYVQMGRELYETEPTFRQHIDHCCERLKALLGLDLRDILYPQTSAAPAEGRPSGGIDLRKMLRRDGNGDTATGKLQQTAYAHPALFVFEYALTQLLGAWGIVPQAMIGHSLGEYVAACVSGVLTLDDALMLVAKRAQLIQALPGGTMLAIPLGEQELRPLLSADLALATVNSAAHCVVSGTAEAVAALEQALAATGIASIRVPSAHAFHSPLMTPIAEEFTRLVASCQLQAPQIPYLSNVTGTWMTAEDATDPSYWARHLCQTVRFADGVRELCREGKYVLLEVGPGQTLSSFATLGRGAEEPERIVLPTIRNQYETRSDSAFLLNTLGQLWLNGVEVDWEGFHAHEQRGRVPLPTYPFERQRFWIDPPQLGQAESNPLGLSVQSRPLPKQRGPADMLYTPLWKRSLFTRSPAALRKLAALQGRKRWLLFSESTGLTAALQGALQQQGQAVVTVAIGEAFAQTGAHAYTLNPNRRSDYEALITALRENGQLPESIVHLWSLSAGAEGAHRAFDDLQHTGFYSLLYLTQALEKAMVTAPLELHIVANDLHDLESADRPCPEKAPLLAASKVIPQEHPNIVCRSFEVQVPEAPAQTERLVQQLLAEFAQPSVEHTIAFRSRQRFVQTYEPLPLDTGSAASDIPGLLRTRGCYLIVGGFGRQGRVLAEYLAQTVQARLILTARTVLPPRLEWERVLATAHTAERNEIVERIRFVQTLEAAGAEVLTLTADVADAAQMEAALQAGEARFGAVHGIIHAAGEMGQDALTTIGDTSPAACAPHFAARVQGMYVLETMLADKSLDFVLLVSSIAAVLGGIGFVAPAAAHQFMDAFAQQQNGNSLTPWLSVNWDRFDIEEVRVLLPYVFALDAVTQVVVSKPDLQESINRWLHFATPERLRDRGATADVAVSIIHPRPNLHNPYVAPSSELEQVIAEILQDLLGIEQVGLHDNFFQLGGNSLLGTQVVTRIRNAFQIDIPLRTLFEANTVAQMALVVEELLIAELEALDEEEASRLGST